MDTEHGTGIDEAGINCESNACTQEKLLSAKKGVGDLRNRSFEASLFCPRLVCNTVKPE